MKEFVRAATLAEHHEFMETMREGMVPENSAEVGLFWYNPERNRLVGVYSYPAMALPFNEKGRKTLRKYHHLEWPSVREEALDNGAQDTIWQEEDYTQVPRGRVFEVQYGDEPYFEVMVGQWINEYPSAKALILKRFKLDKNYTEFIYSPHWDIGHGTSEFLI